MSAEIVDGSKGAKRTFVSSRLGSLLAVAPLGVWTVNHVWDNLSAFQGADAWQTAVTQHPHPVAHGATLAVVLLPLLFHTVWGIARLVSSRPNNQHYGYFSNFRYLIQRVSAVGVLFFLGAHLWLAMIRPRLLLGHAETFADISHEMRHHVPTLVVYLLGTLGVAYHLANGIGTFAMGWGLAVSKQSLRNVERASILFFLVLLGMSWAAIYAMYMAGA
jgi:succinate dehydrogenase / fumarate reductase, cytochrome b subunit